MSNPVNGAIGGFWITTGVGAGSARRASVVAPATVNVADPAALTDGFGAMLSVTATGALRVQLPTGGTPVFPLVVADSVGAAGRVVAPGAGVAIATIAAGSLPAGTYEFQVMAQYDAGAPLAAELNNMEFREGAAVVSVLAVLAVLNVYSPVRRFVLTVNGATAVSVNATAAGTAAVGYNAQIVASRLV